MRVYVPLNSVGLRRLVAEAVLGPSPVTAFAVTPGLREWYLDDDIEELEYAASGEAARASLRLIAADSSSVPRRIVVSADVPEGSLEVRDDLDRGVVKIQSVIPIAWCASIHVDDAEAEDSVRSAAELIDAADLGDPDAQDVVDDAEAFELAWYATQELDDVLADVGDLDG